MNYGIDITLENNPHEVGLGWMVKDKDADYVGKDALRRIKDEGVRQKLVGVEIAGERLDLNMTRWPVKHNGNPVGFITSAVYSPRLKKNIGYAMVPVQYAEMGTELTAETPLGEAAATVVAKPFVDPKKDLPKS